MKSFLGNFYRHFGIFYWSQPNPTNKFLLNIYAMLVFNILIGWPIWSIECHYFEDKLSEKISAKISRYFRVGSAPDAFWYICVLSQIAVIIFNRYLWIQTVIDTDNETLNVVP